MPVFTALQPVFDKIWQAFVVERQPRAVTKSGGCMYRGFKDDGQTLQPGRAHDDYDPHSKIRCAIGVCIPDDMYDPDIEGMGITRMSIEKPKFYESVFNGIPVARLQSLQAIHDDNPEYAIGTMQERLSSYATRHGLTLPE